jgi:hypothetical protein
VSARDTVVSHMTDGRVSVTFKTSPASRAELERQAKAEDRPLSAMIRILLAEALDARLRKVDPLQRRHIGRS